MRSHTTNTDLRVIMRMHGDGVSKEDISKQLDITLEKVSGCIVARTATKRRVHRKKLPVEASPAEAPPAEGIVAA